MPERCPNPAVPRNEAPALRVRDVMVSRPKTLPAHATVGELRRLFANGHVRTALLADGAAFAGVVERADVPAGLPEGASARALARHDVQTVGPDTPAAEALEWLEATPERRLVVLDDDGVTLRGLVCLTADRQGFCTTRDR